jgi:acetyl esterase/lipase
VVPPGSSRKFYELLKQAGADVKYTEYPGVGHNSWDNAFAEPELLPWLFSHHL